MPDSEWIVFLPLVGAILGGIVGAVGGAWANSWYRDREAKKAEERELKGLLLLISAEVYINGLTVRTQTRPNNVSMGLSTNVWDQSQVRLASLLTTREVAALSTYYAFVQIVRDAWGKSDRPELSEDDKKDIAFIRQRGAMVRNIAQKHVSDPNLFRIPFKDDQSKNAEDEREDPEEASPT